MFKSLLFFTRISTTQEETLERNVIFFPKKQRAQIVFLVPARDGSLQKEMRIENYGRTLKILSDSKQTLKKKEPIFYTTDEHFLSRRNISYTWGKYTLTHINLLVKQLSKVSNLSTLFSPIFFKLIWMKIMLMYQKISILWNQISWI